MTLHDDETHVPAPDAPEEGERERSGEAPPPRDPGAERRSIVPDPDPEEAPELLGERSDYPIAWEGEES